MKRQVAAHDPLHQVNGVKLHYLDWDGKGEVLLSLPGLSCTARIFDGLAPKFTDHFRVLALTRRGVRAVRQAGKWLRHQIGRPRHRGFPRRA
jgi:hypothetical protein